jgi:hypothetical protein
MQIYRYFNLIIASNSILLIYTSFSRKKIIGQRNHILSFKIYNMSENPNICVAGLFAIG